MIEFFVAGTPRPAGSKRGFPIKGPGGKVRIGMADDSGAEGKHWRTAVAIAAKSRFGAPTLIAGSVSLFLDFRLLRPKSHYGKRGLKQGAPLRPIVKPDVLKLARAVEDALTGIVWRDDAQVGIMHLSKEYAEHPGVYVRIVEL